MSSDTHRCDAQTCGMAYRPIERCPERAVCAAARRGREAWRHTTFTQPPWPEENDDDDE